MIREKEYENMQEELEDLRKVSKQLKAKCSSAVAEINDLNHEFELEKQQILENYRLKRVENEFLTTLVKQVVQNSDLRFVREKSRYDEINKKWKIPSFALQNKNIVFTKMGGTHVKESLKEKTVKFKAQTSKSSMEKIPCIFEPKVIHSNNVSPEIIRNGRGMRENFLKDNDRFKIINLMPISSPKKSANKIL